MATQYIDPINGSDAALLAKTTTTKSTITAATKANPCQVTLNSHGFSTGNFIYLASVGGMTQLNAKVFQITVVDANNFTLNGIDSTAYSTYTSGGTATPSCSASNPAVVTSLAHGLGNGQLVKPSALTGATWPTINGVIFKIKNVTTDTFELTDILGNNIDTTSYGVCSNAGTWTQWRAIAIQGITKANPAVVTAAGHGYSDGQLVTLDASGMSEVNGKSYTVANKTTNTFELSGVDSSGYGTFTSGTSYRPFKSPNTLYSHFSSSTEGFFYSGELVKIGKTFVKDGSIEVGSGNITFTRDSATVTTSVDLRAVLAVNNHIGLVASGGANGATVEGWNGSDTRPLLYYRISAISATTITLSCRWADTTQTVSSVRRLRLGTEIPLFGTAGTTACSTVCSGVTWEGGYDFIHNASVSRTTGETAVQPATTTGDVYLWTAGGAGETVRYIGGFDAARVFSFSGSAVQEYCFAASRLYYGYQVAASTVTTRYCTASGFSGYQGFFSNTAAPFTYCYAVGVSSGFTNSTGLNTYCVAECIPGFAFGMAANQSLLNCVAKNCASGFNLNTNSFIEGCTADFCSTGAVTTITTISVGIKGCTFSNCTSYGIQLTQTFQPIIEECTFLSNNYDISIDQYSGHVKIINCDSTTPTNYFISRVLNGPVVDVIDCTIDVPSTLKAFQIVVGSSYNMPQYRIQNSFGLPSGSYYATGQYTEDSSVYRTSAPSMKLAYTTTVSTNHFPIKIASFYVAGGVAKTITYRLKRDSGVWVGTITPQLRLGGTVIKSGTDITSLTTSWVDYTISATSGEINDDGELALEFINNANNVAIWIDDVTIA